MPERDWAIDFAICFNNPKHKEISAIACYWLQRVRVLEEAISRFLDACELAERTGAPVSMTPVMWDAFYELRRVYTSRQIEMVARDVVKG